MVPEPATANDNAVVYISYYAAPGTQASAGISTNGGNLLKTIRLQSAQFALAANATSECKASGGVLTVTGRRSGSELCTEAVTMPTNGWFFHSCGSKSVDAVTIAWEPGQPCDGHIVILDNLSFVPEFY
jgi:hypothetical protein